MSGQSSKRFRSPEPQGSVKRPNQEQDPQPVAQLEKAQELFREARKTDLYDKLFDLLDRETPPQEFELEACYSSIFKKLAQIIAGRDDIPVPPSNQCMTFLDLCNPNLEREEWGKKTMELSMKTLINYIKTEDEKKPTLQTPTSNPKPSKSQLVDKLADLVFMIPMVLRPTEDRSGFPQGDMADGQPLLRFFCTKTTKETLELHVQRRYLLFLLKIIAFVDNWINLWKRSGLGIERVAADWKEYLGPPLSPERLKMYTTAIDPSPLRGFEDISDERVEFDHLRNRVKIFIDSVSKKIEPAHTDTQPVIVFYFDEAHHLSKTMVSAEPNRTAYQCLCKAFTYMMNAPVFALFLSTYSRLSETVSSSRNFWSSRPMSSHSEGSDDNMNAPFVELPFDAWKEPSLVIEGTHSAQEICSLKFMARFGRPLFWTVMENTPSIDQEEVVQYAMSKLELRLEDTSRDIFCKFPLQKLIPPLSVRVDLSFELNRDEAVFLEGLLVASSMRTVYSVPKHQQYFRGGYPSEPFVAEAAARAIFTWCHAKGLGRTGSTLPPAEQIEMIIATYKTNIPSAISQWLELGLIDQGTREELVVRMLCTLAHDIAILKNPDHEHVNAVLSGVSGDVSFSQMIRVEDFLRALISEKYIGDVLDARPSNLRGEMLRDAFKDGYVHFTQFVKAGDKSTITDEAIYLLFLRAAAIQGYGNMASTDFVIPVWIPTNNSQYPDRWSMSAIFIQVKNRVNKQFIPIDAQETFQFFTRPQTQNGRKLPYITIVMELGNLAAEQKKAPQPEVKQASTVISRELPQTTRSQALHIHPRYEIAIKGCSSLVYNVIGDEDKSHYSNILAHKDMLAEHPRSEDRDEAVRRMKPYWVAPSSYHWAKMNKESRLGAEVVIADNNNNDDDEYYENTNEEAEEDLVVVNGYSDTEDAGAGDTDAEDVS
ncbi:hypothetical protein J132_01267 [Termitomyces sp. J132]|nr:hypothetical protein J132_01267 [Termitomyces sp. J132]